MHDASAHPCVDLPRFAALPAIRHVTCAMIRKLTQADKRSAHIRCQMTNGVAPARMAG